MVCFITLLLTEKNIDNAYNSTCDNYLWKISKTKRISERKFSGSVFMILFYL